MWTQQPGSSWPRSRWSRRFAGAGSAGSALASTGDRITTATRTALLLLGVFVAVMVGTWALLVLLSTPEPISVRVACVNHQLAPEDIDRPGRGVGCDGWG